MSNFNFGIIAQELNDVQEEGLSFEDKQLTWDTAEDGKRSRISITIFKESNF